MPTENDIEVLGAMYDVSFAQVNDAEADGDDVARRLAARYSSALYLALEAASDACGYMAGRNGGDGR